MAPIPYRRGDTVAYLEVDGDELTVRPVVVESVARLGEGRWSVVTPQAIVEAGADGIGRDQEGVRILPIDEELQAELDRHPDGLVVHETTHDVELTIEQDMEWGEGLEL